MDGQGAAHFFGSQRAAVQAEAVAVARVVKPWLKMRVRFSGGIPTPLSATEILSVPSPLAHPHRQPFVRPPGFVAGVFGIAQQVDQDLQDLVLFDVDRGERFDSRG